MNRTIVITGGTSGIGAACADEFAGVGDKVLLIARHTNGKQGVYEGDVADAEQMTGIFRRIAEEHGKIDVLVNNAGFGLSGATELIPTEEMRKLFDVNYFGVIHCIKAASKYLKQDAKVINISSACALFPLPFRGIYCASKSALNMLTFSLSLEQDKMFADYCCVCPGDVKTNFTKNRVKISDTNEKYGEKVIKSAQFVDSKEDKRMSPQKVAKVVVRQSFKKKMSPMKIVGAKYKVFYFLDKILPKRVLLWGIQKFFLKD